MKKPENCTSIAEIRDEIDCIDKKIIELLGERYKYVKEIVKYKSNAVEVKAQKRYDEVFTLRRKWAEENGLSPDVIEDVYKILVHYFIDEQMKILKVKN
jgi:isochorismate pyruvate lyase